MTDPRIQRALERAPRVHKERETEAAATELRRKFALVDGRLVYRTAYGSRNKVGHPAGWTSSRGYRYVSALGVRYTAHRVTWLLHHGSWPELEVDHIDGNPGNNHPSNLRQADAVTQGGNCKGKSKSGLPKGVTRQDRRFVARLCVGGRDRYLGLFETPEKAHDAYCAAARQHFGEFFCNGVRS